MPSHVVQLTEETVDRPLFLADLPPFPRVALKAMQLLADENSSTPDVVEVIGSDSAFSTELLRAANSPLYGLAHEVRTLGHAISLVGRDRLRSLTMTVALKSYMKAPYRNTFFQDSWGHSVSCALLASGLADICHMNREEAYIAGLLHDVGRVALLITHLKDYSSMLRTVPNEAREMLASERSRFRIDHCQIAKLLLHDWGLPEDLGLAAASHHDDPPPAPHRTKDIVMLACRLATSLGFAAHKQTILWPVDQIASYLPPNMGKPVVLHADVLRDAISKKLTGLC